MKLSVASNIYKTFIQNRKLCTLECVCIGLPDTYYILLPPRTLFALPLEGLLLIILSLDTTNIIIIIN